MLSWMFFFVCSPHRLVPMILCELQTILKRGIDLVYFIFLSILSCVVICVLLKVGEWTDDIYAAVSSAVSYISNTEPILPCGKRQLQGTEKTLGGYTHNARL